MPVGSNITAQFNDSNSCINLFIATVSDKYLAWLIDFENLSPNRPEEELIELLLTAINTLPAKNKQVIELYYFQNKTIEDIKLLTGKSESTVRSNLNYGIFCLKKYFTNKLNHHA